MVSQINVADPNCEVVAGTFVSDATAAIANVKEGTIFNLNDPTDPDYTLPDGYEGQIIFIVNSQSNNVVLTGNLAAAVTINAGEGVNLIFVDGN